MIGSLPVAVHVSNHTQIYKTKLGYAKYSSNRALPRKGFSQTGGWLSPRQVFAKARNIVPVSDRSGLQDYRDMLAAIRENVGALKREGRSLDDTIAAKPTAAFDAKWGRFVITPAFFTRLV